LLPTILSVLAEDAVLFEQFIIALVGDFWVVQCADIRVAECATVSEAVRTAVHTASQTHTYRRRVQVVLDEPSDGHMLIWDSTKDGFCTA
jgi:hypothetical protein